MAGAEGRLCTLSAGGAALGSTRDFSLALNQAEIDVTTRDSTRWHEGILGTRDWSITFSGLYITGDVGKKVLQANYTTATPGTVAVILTINSITYTGTGLVTAMSASAPYNGVVEWTGTVKGTGALTLSVS